MRTPRTRTLPLFYTHPIGSLPRPQMVRDLFARRAEFSDEKFRALLDDAVRFAIHLQELAGLDVVSDGEWRRVQYIREFLLRVGGFERVRKYEHQGETKLTEVVVRRMGSADPVFAPDGKFLVENTDRQTKFALPSPFLIAIRYWHPDHSRDAYSTWESFLEHLSEILAREAQALAAAGIDIIQLDDPALTYFCDAALMAGETHDERLRRNWDIERELPLAVGALNRIVENVPAEIHLHCCHSVYKRRSDVAGNYGPLLPYLEDLHFDRINLEFAYQGTGEANDLELLPPHLDAGMGVVDVRSATLQSVEDIEQLARAGANVIEPERIALNPDCGFAPDAGEPPTIDEAYEKLCRLTAAAKKLRAEYAK